MPWVIVGESKPSMSGMSPTQDFWENNRKQRKKEGNVPNINTKN